MAEQMKKTMDESLKKHAPSHFWSENSSPYCFRTPNCEKSTSKYSCSACRICTHISCVSELKINCKNCPSNQNEENKINRHHWIPRSQLKEDCIICHKPIRSSNKGIVEGYICSWCKARIHNSSPCYETAQTESVCHFGQFKDYIIPPYIFQHFSFPLENENSSLKFVIKYNPTEHPEFDFPKKPLVVFINPKSGGNLGAKLLKEFRWLLNPSQVFDVMESPIQKILESFIYIPNLHILICGGDGTISWLYSVIDKYELPGPGPVSVFMPLGTGNDLARTFKWGGQYNHSSPASFLKGMNKSRVVCLDRWSLTVENTIKTEATPEKANVGSSESGENPIVSKTEPKNPNSFTNYFSLGLDAEVAMNFHKGRTACPEMYSNRVINKLHYGRIGLVSMIKNSQSQLYEAIESFVIDDVEQIARLVELKPKCVLFLNIPSYSAGTLPWGSEESKDFKKQKTDDGLLEVVVLSSSRMVMLRMGVAAKRFAQCKKIKVVTKEIVPMQVDGEPCVLEASTITVSFHKQSLVLEKRSRKDVNGIENTCHEPSEIKPCVHCDTEPNKTANQFVESKIESSRKTPSSSKLKHSSSQSDSDVLAQMHSSIHSQEEIGDLQVIKRTSSIGRIDDVSEEESSSVQPDSRLSAITFEGNVGFSQSNELSDPSEAHIQFTDTSPSFNSLSDQRDN